MQFGGVATIRGAVQSPERLLGFDGAAELAEEDGMPSFGIGEEHRDAQGGAVRAHSNPRSTGPASERNSKRELVNGLLETVQDALVRVIAYRVLLGGSHG